MLLDSKEIAELESRLMTLFDRTIRKGLHKEPGKKIKYSVKQAFSSKTFQIQLDKIIDDIVLYTIDYVDSEVSQLNEQISASTNPSKRVTKLSASNETLILTEEAVRQSTDLSSEIAESIIRTLKDEAIYQEHPSKLAKRVLDLWGGEKYRAERWARTFSADVATSTSLYRYKQQGIENVQFYATIDKRTSPQCRAMHGVVMITDSIESQKYRPPLHHHCLVAGTKILTINGEKNIEDVCMFDLVLTHRNNYYPVYGLMSREADDIIEITTTNRTLKITSNHPVLTKRNNEIYWIQAGELTEEDEIVVM